MKCEVTKARSCAVRKKASTVEMVVSVEDARGRRSREGVLLRPQLSSSSPVKLPSTTAHSLQAGAPTAMGNVEVHSPKSRSSCNCWGSRSEQATLSQAKVTPSFSETSLLHTQ